MSVQLFLPVTRDAAGRAGRRLVERVVMRWSENRSLCDLIGPVVIEPVLARLEALDDRMAACHDMVASVLRRR